VTPPLPLPSKGRGFFLGLPQTPKREPSPNPQKGNPPPTPSEEGAFIRPKLTNSPTQKLCVSVEDEYCVNINTVNGMKTLMYYKRVMRKVQPAVFFLIFAVLIKRGGMHMLTENEVRDDKKKIDYKQVETSAQKPMPSIWYN
jgi:hypothetical protein